MKSILLFFFVFIFGYIKSQPLKWKIELQINQIIDVNGNNLKVINTSYDASNESKINYLEKACLISPIKLNINVYGINNFIFIYNNDSLKVDVIHNASFLLLDQVFVNQLIIKQINVNLDFTKFIDLKEFDNNPNKASIIIEKFPE